MNRILNLHAPGIILFILIIVVNIVHVSLISLFLFFKLNYDLFVNIYI